MTGDIEHRKPVYFSGFRTAGSVIVAGLYLLSPAFWSSVAWGQQSRIELAQVQTKPKTPANPIVQPKPVQPPSPSPNLAPVVLPVINPSSALGTALASCESETGTSELSLPSAKGEIRLDQCYRGRDHLVCQSNALLTEAKSILENYRKIVDANYHEVREITGLCAIKSDALTSNLQNAMEFASRFRDLKVEYESLANCATKIKQSFTQVTFPEMTQAQGLLKSMSDAIDGDVKGVSEMQGKLSELAEKMSSAQKAMVTLQKIHRAMCVKDQRSGTGAIDPAKRLTGDARGLLRGGDGLPVATEVGS
jgi:hypothetical protein